MRMYFMDLAHLLVIIAVADVILGSPLTLLLPPNASYARGNIDHSNTANRLKGDKPTGERKVYIIDYKSLINLSFIFLSYLANLLQDLQFLL